MATVSEERLGTLYYLETDPVPGVTMSFIRIHFRSKISIASILPVCCLLQACLFSWGGRGESTEVPMDGEKPRIGRGYYTFDQPTAASRLNLDSTYTVEWRASDSAGQGPVWVSLYWDEDLLGLVLGSLNGSGSYEWKPAAMVNLGYRLGSGSGYRFRIVSDADSSKWDFSPRFALYSDYSGSLQLSVPAQGAQTRGDSALRIAWTLTGNAGSLVGLQLYRDTNLIHTIDLSVPAAEGEYSWSAIPEWLPAGDGYRIRIFSISDASISQMGPAFSINVPARIGTYEFLRPRSGDVWVAGELGYVEWAVTGNPGSFSGLTLWRDTPRELVWSWTPGDTHNSPAELNLPASLVGGTYRMRIGSLVDTTLFAFSTAFTIQGPGTP